MTATELVVYLGSYDTPSGAVDDFAAIQRLRRDGVLPLADGAVVVPAQISGEFQRDAAFSAPNAAPAGELVAQLLRMLSPRLVAAGSVISLGGLQPAVDTSPAWL